MLNMACGSPMLMPVVVLGSLDIPPAYIHIFQCSLIIPFAHSGFFTSDLTEIKSTVLLCYSGFDLKEDNEIKLTY